MKAINRGDIIHIDLEPTLGREQQGKRFALVVSGAAFNALGVAWIVPVTQGGEHARHAGFTVPLSGSGLRTQGVALCHQMRAADLKARKAKRIETAPDFIVEAVLDRLRALLD